jgi:hypothetical protein
MTATFEQNLAFGKIAETYIALWLRRTRGFSILPIYEKEISEGKGPRFFTPHSEVVAPDMLAMKDNMVRWVEAKHKDVFTWWRIGQCWETGIDLHHYEEYLKIADTHPWNIWLLFLHERDYNERRPNEPWPCPTGLFAGDIRYLRHHESHRDDRWGKHGMVYWKDTTLRKIATLEEVKAAYHMDPVL